MSNSNTNGEAKERVRTSVLRVVRVQPVCTYERSYLSNLRVKMKIKPQEPRVLPLRPEDVQPSSPSPAHR